MAPNTRRSKPYFSFQSTREGLKFIQQNENYNTTEILLIGSGIQGDVFVGDERKLMRERERYRKDGGRGVIE